MTGGPGLKPASKLQAAYIALAGFTMFGCEKPKEQDAGSASTPNEPVPISAKTSATPLSLEISLYTVEKGDSLWQAL